MNVDEMAATLRTQQDELTTQINEMRTERNSLAKAIKAHIDELKRINRLIRAIDGRKRGSQ